MPTQEYLLSRFEYFPETGILKWRPVTSGTHTKPNWWNTMNAGKAVGSPNPDGHLMVHLDYQRFGIARIIWKMMTGNEPYDLIDHKDRVPSNNKFSNLREADRAQNNSNTGARSNSKSGVKGVWHSTTVVKGKSYGRWQAKIKVNGKSIHLGSFKTCEDASTAYKAAAIKHHGEFARFE